MKQPPYNCDYIQSIQKEAAQLWERNKDSMPTDSKDWNSIMYICMSLDVLKARVGNLRDWGLHLMKQYEERTCLYIAEYLAKRLEKEGESCKWKFLAFRQMKGVIGTLKRS